MPSIMADRGRHPTLIAFPRMQVARSKEKKRAMIRGRWRAAFLGAARQANGGKLGLGSVAQLLLLARKTAASSGEQGVSAGVGAVALAAIAFGRSLV